MSTMLLRIFGGTRTALGSRVQPWTSGFPRPPAFLPAMMATPEPRRSAGSFFQKNRSSDELWKAVTSVSNQGRQRGRAKGLVRYKNLNRGQRLGMGPARVSFPGLTTGALDRDRKRQQIGKIGEADYLKYTDGLQELRASAGSGASRRFLRRQTPLERGWTGASPQGRKFGAPLSPNPERECPRTIDPTDLTGSLNPDMRMDDSCKAILIPVKFEHFESVLIEYRTIISMTGTFGRTRSLRLLMVTGNRNGVAGFALTRSPTGRGPYTFQRAVNKAGLRLCYIPRYEDRTVYHDFFSNFGSTRLMVRQKPPGYGVEAQRVIKGICDMVGIKDLKVEVEGSRNYLHICKAFFLGLLRQRTHQELANEKRLHLVEFRQENDNFPKVVASPEDGYIRTSEEIGPNEILDFEMISFDGNLPHVVPEKGPFYERLPSWQTRLKKVKPQEHHFQQRLDMMVEDGRVASHLTDTFPECKPIGLVDKEKRLKKLLEQEDAAHASS